MTGIKTYRLAANITQKELAERLHTTRSSVAMWETGESRPRAEKLPEIARLLGCSVDDLFKEQTVS